MENKKKTTKQKVVEEYHRIRKTIDNYTIERLKPIFKSIIFINVFVFLSLCYYFYNNPIIDEITLRSETFCTHFFCIFIVMLFMNFVLANLHEMFERYYVINHSQYPRMINAQKTYAELVKYEENLALAKKYFPEDVCEIV